jgi:general secretion pathway protein L
MPKLLLRLLSGASQTEEGLDLSVEWAVTEDDGSERARGVTDHQGIADLLDPASDWQQNPDNIVVVVPSQCVFTIACEVPGRSSAQIRKAIPFVLEEYLATDLDAVHLALGEIRIGKPTTCHVLERELLQGWLDALRATGLEPAWFVAEADLLESTPDGATILLEGSSALLKSDREIAFIDRENLAFVLSGLSSNTLRIINGTLTPRERASLSPDTAVSEASPQHASESSSIGYLASRLFSDAAPANLLQGVFAPVRRHRESLRQWRLGAGLAASWFFVAVLFNGANALSASRQADQLESEAIALYKDIFPEARQIPNPRRQMQQALGEKGDGGDSSMLNMLSRLSMVVGAESRVQRVDFSAESGETAMDLLVPGYEQLDQLKSALAEEGLTAEIVSAEQQTVGVRARIRLLQSDGGRSS